MKQKPAGGAFGGAERIVERAKRVEAVDRGGEVAFAGERELPEENLHLLLDWGAVQADEVRVIGLGAIEHPAVEADLADAGARISVQPDEEVFLPVGGAVADIPRVQAVAGQHDGMGCSKRGHIRPVGFGRAVGHHAPYAGRGEVGEDAIQVRSEHRVVQMIMGVVEIHFTAKYAKSAKVRSGSF